MICGLTRQSQMNISSSWTNQQAITTKKPKPATLVPTKLNAREISAMTVKCTFCNDTKQEPGIPGPCVWCEQVGATPVAVGYQLAKGFTDPVGDCEKFEAGITVNAWLQRIVVYGDSPADAEALRDHIMSSAEREAALREELSKLADDYCEKVDDLVDLQQRLTEAERYVQKMIDCSQGQDSIATGYLADILAKLKPVDGKVPVATDFGR